jgi:hypothetical protein
MGNDEETTTFGLSSRKLARLFFIGSGEHRIESGPDEEQTMAELLHDRLSETVPTASETTPDRRTREGNLRHMTDVLSGERMGRLLSNAETEIVLIQRIKEYARKLSTSAQSKAEHRVANTLYYAAIAHALVHGGQKITTHPDRDLMKSFARLSAEKWMPASLACLFRKAQEARPQERTP